MSARAKSLSDKAIPATERLIFALDVPTAQRLWVVAEALRTGQSAGEVAAQSQFDPWFVEQMAEMLGVPVGTLKNQVFRLRERWRELLFAQVAATLENPTPEEIKAELSELLGAV